MNGAKNRSYLMGVVGGYLLYLAYQMFEERNSESSMSMAVRILFMVFFIIAGIGLMVYAWRIWKIADKAERAKKEEPVPENKDAMK